MGKRPTAEPHGVTRDRADELLDRLLAKAPPGTVRPYTDLVLSTARRMLRHLVDLTGQGTRAAYCGLAYLGGVIHPEVSGSGRTWRGQPREVLSDSHMGRAGGLLTDLGVIESTRRYDSVAAVWLTSLRRLTDTALAELRLVAHQRQPKAKREPRRPGPHELEAINLRSRDAALAVALVDVEPAADPSEATSPVEPEASAANARQLREGLRRLGKAPP